MADFLELASLAGYVCMLNGSLPSDRGALPGFATPDVDISDALMPRHLKTCRLAKSSSSFVHQSEGKAE